MQSVEAAGLLQGENISRRLDFEHVEGEERHEIIVNTGNEED